MAHNLEFPPIEKVSKLIPKLKTILKACILKDLGFSDAMIIQGMEEYLKMQREQYQFYEVFLD